MKERLKKYWYVAILILIVIILLGIIVLRQDNVSKTSTEGIIKNTLIPKSKEELISNIEVEDEILKDGTLITIIKNNNNCDVKNLVIEPIFYDTEDNVVGTAKSNFRVIKAGSEVAVNDYSVPNKFEKHKINLNISEGREYESYTDKISVTSNNTGEKVMVTAINESEVDLARLNIAVVYYKEGKPVGLFEETQYQIKKGETKYFNIMYAYDKNYDNVEFDEYKIFINSAYDTI